MSPGRTGPDLQAENARLARALRRAQRTVDGLTLGVNALRTHSQELSEENAQIREELNSFRAGSQADAGGTSLPNRRSSGARSAQRGDVGRSPPRGFGTGLVQLARREADAE